MRIYMTYADARTVRYSLILFAATNNSAHDVWADDAREVDRKVVDALKNATYDDTAWDVTLDVNYYDVRTILATLAALTIHRIDTTQSIYDTTRIMAVFGEIAEIERKVVDRFKPGDVSEQDMAERESEMAEQR